MRLVMRPVKQLDLAPAGGLSNHPHFSDGPPVLPGGLSLASFFVVNKRRNVVDHDKAREIDGRTDGQEDERDPNG